jgi:hypothetical protein
MSPAPMNATPMGRDDAAIATGHDILPMHGQSVMMPDGESLCKKGESDAARGWKVW